MISPAHQPAERDVLVATPINGAHPELHEVLGCAVCKMDIKAAATAAQSQLSTLRTVSCASPMFMILLNNRLKLCTPRYQTGHADTSTQAVDMDSFSRL